MRNRMRTCVWYSLIESSWTSALVSRMSIPSIPRSVFAASCNACCAASRHDSDDTPTRSMVLMTATFRLLSVPVPADSRRVLSALRVQGLPEAERPTPIAHPGFVERDGDGAVDVGVQQRD